MIAFAGVWAHALAASLFGALAVWVARSAREPGERSLFAVAALTTAIWALAGAMAGPDQGVARLAEHGRNLAWLAFMYRLWTQGRDRSAAVPVAFLYGILSAVLAFAAVIDLAVPWLTGIPRLAEAALRTAIVLQMMMAAGALVLVHNLYTAATPDTRTALRLPLVALAVMWLYDLNLYTVFNLARGWAGDLLALRGVAMVLIAPIFALGVHRAGRWTVQLSRSMAFQSLGVVAVGGYLVAVVLITSALDLLGGELVRVLQVAFVFGASIAALILLPSRAFRAWFRVKIAKHLFQHRYDYRQEWQRFTDTIGRRGSDASPIEERIVQAVADITESPGGLLLVPDESGALAPMASWNWPQVQAPSYAAGPALGEAFLRTGRIVALDALSATGDDEGDDGLVIPEWIVAEPAAWAIVPLIHFDRLAGLVLLHRPVINRTLDWEDFDLLRAVGRQAASYLAEAQGQEALSDIRRFDEFNRRFAFIMHDVKNLVSQLTLVTRNAERHADNPEFRADMIATLRSSTARMNDLLARLSQHNKARTENPVPLRALDLVEGVARTRRPIHPVVVAGGGDLTVLADPQRLEQALQHLVQNAIEASPRTEPVLIELAARGDEGFIAIEDKGPGMSSAFIREKLFKPFASTKENGFGIGAYEARSLIAGMGGRIEVSSREGRGSRFEIVLPLAAGTSHLHRAEAA